MTTMSEYSEIQHRTETAIRAAQTATGDNDPARQAAEAAASVRPALESMERMRKPLVILKTPVPVAK